MESEDVGIADKGHGVGLGVVDRLTVGRNLQKNKLRKNVHIGIKKIIYQNNVLIFLLIMNIKGY